MSEYEYLSLIGTLQVNNIKESVGTALFSPSFAPDSVEFLSK